jgi:hypothetical protein
MTIYDTPFNNFGRHWLKEMADLETEECFDDFYPASLVLAAAPLPTLVTRASLVETQAHATVTEQDHRPARAPRQVGEVDEAGALAASRLEECGE